MSAAIHTAPAPKMATTQARRSAGSGQRAFVVDLLKAAGCVLIVLHHLAFYGPMADVVATVWPQSIGFLAQHARLAVQVFLVCAGFLAARSLHAAPMQTLHAVGRAWVRRYLRLALPLLAALALTLLLSEAIRPGFAHDSLSATPHLGEVLAHVFFVQHLLDVPALSAGVWYVAIDLQLYGLCLGLSWLGQRAGQHGGAARAQAVQLTLVLGLCLLSLLWWSHVDALDDVALFFAGSYGLGWLAWHARATSAPAGSHRHWAALALCVVCIWADSRGRALTAAAAAGLLAYAPQAWMALHPEGRSLALRRVLVRWVAGLARVSYAVFVVHFGVSLAVNAWVHTHWPRLWQANALGMGLALLVSIGAGHVLHLATERSLATWRRWAAWVLVLLSCTAAAGWLAALQA